MKDRFRLYRLLDRIPLGSSYLGKFLLVAAVGLLPPVLALVALLAVFLPSMWVLALIVGALCWLIGLMLCWLGFGALLKPVDDTATAVSRGVDKRTAPDLDTGLTDLAGRLMADTQRSLTLLGEFRRQTAVDRTTDPLTGLINKRSAFRRLGADLLRSSRDQKPVCVALIEIDNLESLAQRLGQDSVDTIVKTVSHVIVGEIRRSDWVASYANDQFLVGLWGVDAAAAEVALERVGVQLKANRQYPVTLSIGLTRAAERARPDHVVANAAHAMALARRAGGNRVVVEDRAS